MNSPCVISRNLNKTKRRVDGYLICQTEMVVTNCSVRIRFQSENIAFWRAKRQIISSREKMKETSVTLLAITLSFSNSAEVYY